ncbi:MAG: hypothetical protein K5912_03910 [Alphaproteobacteria bacterium]|nr:hypothetical protein [Alphaproteobacteria bacterium]
MKKTLLSAIAGLAVIGSASAMPTPGQAKENCERLVNNGTHVGWCEKYKECVEQQPCNSDDERQRQLFCKSNGNRGDSFVLQSPTNTTVVNEKARIVKAWIRAFMEFSYNEQVKDYDFLPAFLLPSLPNMFKTNNCYYQVKVHVPKIPNNSQSWGEDYIQDALLAYGWTPEKVNLEISRKTGTNEMKCVFNVPREDICNNIRDTANLLSKSGRVFGTPKFNNGECILTFTKNEDYQK